MEREFKIAGVSGGLGLAAWILGGPLAGLLIAAGGFLIGQKQFPEGERPWKSIQDLLANGEGLHLEFKQALSFKIKNNKPFHGIIKSLAAFANTEGGEILLGVSDKAEIIGIDKIVSEAGNEDKFLLAIHDAVRNGLQPPISQYYRTKFEKISNKLLLRIEVDKSQSDIFSKDGQYYSRQGNRTITLSTHEFHETKKKNQI